MINKEIIIYEIEAKDDKPKVQNFVNEYYNKEGMDFAKSLKWITILFNFYYMQNFAFESKF